MKISIIHPSRGRPVQAFQTMNKWIGNADSDIEYVIVCDTDDPSLSGYLTPNEFIIHGFHKSAIEAINAGARIINGDLIIVVSDDFDCPLHWDTLLLQALEGKEDFCVKTKDGIQRTLMTLPIMDRKYYERFGYIYHPDYLHMFCDQEMTAVAHMLGRNIDVNITFPHNHYSTGKFKKDAISVKNDSTWIQGQTVFNHRKLKNFGIKNPVKPYSAIRWH